MNRQRLQEIRGYVSQIKSAPVETLGALYEEYIGYDPILEGGREADEELRADLLDFIREVCHSEGIHVSTIGLSE